MAEEDGFPLDRRGAVERVAALLADPPRVSTGRTGLALPLATGLGASPGLASGAIATSPERAATAADAGTSVILVRAETSPDDVHGMARAAGILTSRGGLASHAAVVARGWGIPAVVGASAVEVSAGSIRIGERTLHESDVISIDGSTGEVFAGAVAGTTEPVPEARTLLAWAAELGIPIEAGDEAPGGTGAGVASRRATLDDVIRVVSIKGFATTANLADALGSAPDAVQPFLDQLVVDGLAATVAGAYRLTDPGSARAGELLARDRSGWGAEAAAAALDTFVALDHRMKDTVTAWQLLPAAEGAEPAINDHSDAAYDRSVLDRLANLHADAVAWLQSLEAPCPRLAGYRPRLDRALERAVAGDQKYVASPRVDSYHGVWFELHEDLIQLAGRTRAEEVEAGRA
jgi:pyruvate,orthophosphate dikinase